MAYGLRISYGADGSQKLTIDGKFLRFIASVQAVKGQSGSYQLPAGYNHLNAVWFYAPTNPDMVPHVVTLNANGLLSWRPYTTSPDFHASGTIRVAAIA